MELDPLNVVPRVESAPSVTVASVPRVDDMARRVGPDPAPGRIERATAWVAARYGRLAAVLCVLPPAAFAGWVFSEIGSFQHALLRASTFVLLGTLVTHLLLGLGLLVHHGVRRSRARRVEREARLSAMGRDGPSRDAIERAYRPLIEHRFPGAGRTYEAAGTALFMLLCAIGACAASSVWYSAIDDGGEGTLMGFAWTLSGIGLESWMVLRFRRVVREARLFFQWALEAARRGVPATGPMVGGPVPTAPTFRPYGWKPDSPRGTDAP